MSRAIELADQAWRLRANAMREQLSGEEAERRRSKCLGLLEQAKDLAKSENDDYGLAYALNKLAHLRADLGRREAAIELLLEAAEAGRRAQSGLLEGEALRHWADHLRHENKLEEAESIYWRAVEALKSDSETSTLSLGNAYRPIAILYTALGDSEKAIRYWRKARKLYAEAGIAAGIEECDTNLVKLKNILDSS
ncbi:MAG: tetratricopeptide repeat protein [Gammaproteobacteria bacterium]|nr:tetratricopeptide repeat protein [Gammaproteobacteria bacterium]